ncbi:MAG: phage-shock protein [Pseudomonadota bacterium]
MHGVFIVGIVFSGIVIALAIISGTILMAIRLYSGVSTRHRNNETEEAKLIQEIYAGLSRMEKRVETLETILMERTGKDR